MIFIDPPEGIDNFSDQFNSSRRKEVIKVVIAILMPEAEFCTLIQIYHSRHVG